MPGRWTCRAYWYALPNNLRSWIGRAYRQGIERGNHPSRSYIDAHHAALAWIREHARPACGQEVTAALYGRGRDRDDLEDVR
jgi:hypothetical protein